MARVILQSVGDNKVAVIKVVKDWFGLGLAEAKNLVESAPAVLKDKAHQSEADELGKLLEEAGGTVEIVQADVIDPTVDFIDQMTNRLRWAAGVCDALTQDEDLDEPVLDAISNVAEQLREARELVRLVLTAEASNAELDDHESKREISIRLAEKDFENATLALERVDTLLRSIRNQVGDDSDIVVLSQTAGIALAEAEKIFIEGYRVVGR